MAARPQTLYGIADSPVGLAAWLIDHNDADGQPAAAVVEALERTTSDTGELTRDEVLDNVTLYWLTNTGVSASRLYWEYKGGFFDVRRLHPGGRDRLSQRAVRGAAGWAERRIPSSSTTTRSRRAATSPPGSSRRSSRRSCAPALDRCARHSAPAFHPQQQASTSPLLAAARRVRLDGQVRRPGALASASKRQRSNV